MPVDMYSSQGILSDLNAYMDSDPTVDREDFFDKVFEAFSIQGRLPCVTNSVLALSFFATPEAVGDAKGWTVDDYMAYMDDHPSRVYGTASSTQTK